MRQSRLSHESFQAKELPEKEQWSIIYKHRAMQLEKAKSLQQIASRQQKDAIKQYLDEQVLYKKSLGKAEKKEDVKYYENIVQNVGQMNEKQQKEKIEKYLKRKEIQKYNRKLFEQALTPRRKVMDSAFNMDIGLQSEIQKRQRAEQIRQDVLQALDRQKKQRQLQNLQRREKEMQQYRKNQAYQLQQYTDRTMKNRPYHQHQGVYNSYRDIYNQKMRKDKQLQQNFVDKVQQMKIQQETFKNQAERMKKQRATLQMQDALQKQIQIVNFRKSQDKNPNPEQASYSFMNSVFQQKRKPINKQEYSKFLEKQMQQQRFYKQKHRYMNQEQYKFHSNQLKNALSRNETSQKYYDSSINTIGDHANLTAVEPLQGNDADIVRTKLKSLRNPKDRSMIVGRPQIGTNFY